jgi:CubicO group peptidase (beta-lactamase class C family)
MRKLAAFVAAIMGAAFLSGAVAQTPPAAVPPTPQVQSEKQGVSIPAPPAAGIRELSAQDVNAWLDGFLPYALGKGDIAGAVVTVVKDGQVLTSRGFGYADVEKRAPVVPDQTLFRPGSVSKLITWTAVMQQVEQPT